MSTSIKNIFQPKLNYKIHHFATRTNLCDYAILDTLLKSDKFVTLTIFANGKNVFLLGFKNGKLLTINAKPVGTHTIIQRNPGSIKSNEKVLDKKKRPKKHQEGKWVESV